MYPRESMKSNFMVSRGFVICGCVSYTPPLLEGGMGGVNTNNSLGKQKFSAFNRVLC